MSSFTLAHIAQHHSFVIASLAFWSAMAGAAITGPCSARPWYAPYAALGVTGLGLDPATEQKLAGLVMWIPGGVIHGGTALFSIYRWLNVAPGPVPARR